MFSPTGKRIVAVLEVAQITARIENMKRGEEGNLTWEYTGENIFDAATQQPILHEGQRCFFDEEGQLWRESQLSSVLRLAS